MGACQATALVGELELPADDPQRLAGELADLGSRWTPCAWRVSDPSTTRRAVSRRSRVRRTAHPDLPRDPLLSVVIPIDGGRGALDAFDR